MSVLSVQNVEMYFSDRLLFKNVSFELGERETAGLVGANGTGKTTLFRLITGELEPSGGQIVKSRGVTVGYMEQHVFSGSQRSVYDEMLSVFDRLMNMEKELERLNRQIEKGGENLDELINLQNSLSEEFQRCDGLVYKSKTRAALLGLGFGEDEFNMSCSKLSGGQRSKLSLGKLLLSGADLLLLDEPTNHLDISSVEWLESFLSEYRGSVLIISHDRYFLDKVTTKTFDISSKTLRVWKGSYSVYQKQKAEKAEYEKRLYENRMDEIKRIEGIIEQQRQFGRQRNFITIASKEKMLEKKRGELVVPEQAAAEVHFNFKPVAESGNEVLIIKELSKSFGSKKLFSGVDIQLNKGDRAFLLGPNGCGKTTLLKIIKNELRADNGTVRLGANVKMGYFDQTLFGLHNDKTALDEIWDIHRSMETTEVRSALAAFLFRGEDVYKKVGELSGGEKARLALLKLVLSGANFLLLDEPTNHLDINSREALETALQGYNGTILAVSHDRYFINKLCTRVLHLTRGGVAEYTGNYDSYAEKLAAGVSVRKPENQVRPNDYRLRKERESEKRRLEGKIRRCEEKIEAADGEVEAVNALLSTPEIAADYEKVLQYTEKLEALRAEQENLMTEWTALQEKAEKFGEDEL